MTTQRTFGPVSFQVARFTRLDRCGRPVYSNESRLITDGLISVEASANIDEGEAIERTNAAGKRCIYRAPKPRHNGYTVTLNLCGVDPFVVNFTTGEPLVENGAGDIAGFDVDTEVSGTDAGFALELWNDLGEGDVCAPTAGEKVGYMILPFLSGGVIGDFTVENDAVDFSVSNAQSKKGHSWGTGPYLVDVDEGGAPVALAPIRPSVALRVLEVGLTPPGVSDGAIPLDDPAAPEATGATAGTPGAFTPAGAFRPETVDDMDGITASPTTAWTAGQFVMLQDGTPAHWTGTAWAAGPA